MTESIQLLELRETFIFLKPLAEPDATWREPSYSTERLVTMEGHIIWYGLGTNWMKQNGGCWTYLGEDPLVQPTADGIYPKERLIWIPCEEPIYETMRREYYKRQHV